LRPGAPERLKAPAVRVRAMLSTSEAELRERRKLKSLVSPQTIWCGLSEPKAKGVWVDVGLGAGLCVSLGLSEGLKLGEAVAVGLAVGVRLALGEGLGVAL